MEIGVSGVVKRVFEKKAVRLTVIGIVGVAVLGTGLFFTIKKITGGSGSTQKQQTTVVRRGNLVSTISGSGTITSSDRVQFSSLLNATVTKVNFKEGDSVKAGDILFELDDSDAKQNVANVENNILQAQLSSQSSGSDVGKLSLTAPFSGQVSGISVKVGDVVNKNANILTLTDRSRLKLLLPFSNVNGNGIRAGQSVQVYIQDVMESVKGTVTYVSTDPYTTASGGELYNVEISISNPGSLSEGMKANAEITTSKGTVSSTDNGTLSYVNAQVLKTETGGTVKSISVKENQNVHGSQVLVTFENNDVLVSSQSNDAKLTNLNAQLETAKKQLGYCTIRSSIDGIIVSQSVKAGDVVKTGDVMSTVVDAGHMEFQIPVDELDIAKMAVGQKASISLDALSDTASRPLSGQVSKIALQGTSSNGVTTYPVTVTIDETDKLKEGMNANATITVAEKDNVLILPIEAVTKMGSRAIVMVKGGSGASGNMQPGMGNWGGYSGGSGNGGNGANNGSRRNRQSGSTGGNGAGAGNAGSDNKTAGSGSANQGGISGAPSRNGSNPAGASGSGQRSGNLPGAFSRNSKYYAGATPIMVEIGLNSSNYIEIVSGLKEGDVVVLPPVTASTSSGTNQNGNGMGLGALGGGSFGGGSFGGGSFGGGSFGGGNNRQSGTSRQRGN